MSNLKILLVVIAAVIIAFLAICIVIPKLVKKGIDLSGILSGSGTALSAADMAVAALQKMMPDNKALVILDKIIDYAQAGVESAEQLYKASKIESYERNDAVKEFVYRCLSLAGIDATEQIDSLIDGCIEAAVFTLPATHVITEANNRYGNTEAHDASIPKTDIDDNWKL